jgi:transposase-like protein
MMATLAVEAGFTSHRRHNLQTAKGGSRRNRPVETGLSSNRLGTTADRTHRDSEPLGHGCHGKPLTAQPGDLSGIGTDLGGKARNMHAEKRRRIITGTGGKDKTVAVGLLERGGKVCASVMPSRKKNALQSQVRKYVKAGSALYSDALKSYDGLDAEYAHKVIDHAVAYVDGRVHTNGLENFWSLVKGGLKGTYVSVEPFHLFRYLDEQSFRYNQRKIDDLAQFLVVMAAVVNRRLTYNQLIGAHM